MRDIVVQSPYLLEDKVETLTQSLLHVKEYIGETFVIRCNSSVIEDEKLLKAFAKDVVALKGCGVNPVIVHGGARVVNTKLAEFNIRPQASGAKSYSIVEVIEMIMSGYINKRIVSKIVAVGGAAVGISGKDGGLLYAKRMKRRKKYSNSNIEQIFDLNFMGDLDAVNPTVLIECEETEIIPVISPMAIGDKGQTLQVNADELSSVIANALGAYKLVIMSDTNVASAGGKRINKICMSEAEKFVKDEGVDESLRIKIQSCIDAIEQCTETAHIINANICHSLLLEVFTDEGVGTAFYTT
jgi:acetylglutamate kinase